MADYWKSIDKKYCDICKCWITDNNTSVQVHENGKRHQINAQMRLREIQKKARSNEKEEKKIAKTLRQIEAAASLAVAQDKEANPDMSLKIQTYKEKLLEQELELARAEGVTISSSVEEPLKPKILHRDEKQAEQDAAYEPPKIKKYTSRFGGWTPADKSTKDLDLELPSSSYSVSTGKSKKSSTTKQQPQIEYTQKVTEKRKHIFEEKTLPSFVTTSFTPVVDSTKTQPVIEFKKRKFVQSHSRKSLND